jgi:hypothetical protein
MKMRTDETGCIIGKLKVADGARFEAKAAGRGRVSTGSAVQISTNEG